MTFSDSGNSDGSDKVIEMEEITELNTEKYLVFKYDDLNKALSPEQLNELAIIMTAVSRTRTNNNNYLVLNLDDEIDIDSFQYKISPFQLTEKQKTELEEMGIKDREHRILKVRDIAVPIVSAILNAKEG